MSISSGFREMVKPCWKPSVEGDGGRRNRQIGDPNGRVDGLLWYKDLGYHVNGEFLMAVIQANNLLEDQSQVESGPLSSLDSGPRGTFIGVYDGHGGPETSQFVNENLIPNLKRDISSLGCPTNNISSAPMVNMADYPLFIKDVSSFG